MSGWIELQQSPYISSSNVQQIDSLNFIVASASKSWRTTDGSGGFFNYDTLSNKWTLLTKYPDQLDCAQIHICYDKQNKKIFMMGYQQKFRIYDYNNDTFKLLKDDTNISSFPHMILLNGKLNVIGGADNNFHFIWNEKDNKFEKIFEFKAWSKGCNDGRLIHIKSKHLLLLFGGYDYGSIAAQDIIWSHYIGSSKWHKLQIKMPYKSYGMGCILTSDEKYIVMFGGSSSKDAIWILDFDKMEWKLSKIKCPLQNEYFTTLISNKKNDQLLVSGFVRMVDNVAMLPQDVMNVLFKWYSVEYIHLLAKAKKSHWKINVDEIFS